jgi:hypothetical protein
VGSGWRERIGTFDSQLHTSVVSLYLTHNFIVLVKEQSVMHITDEWKYTFASSITLEQLPEFYRSMTFLSFQIDKAAPNAIEVVGHHERFGIVVVGQFDEGAILLSPQELPGFELHSIGSKDENDILDACHAWKEGDFEDDAQFLFAEDEAVAHISEEKQARLRRLSGIALRIAAEKAEAADLI